jgi:hypothetical protein
VIEFSVPSPTIPIPFHKLLKVVAIVDREDGQTRQLLDQLAISWSLLLQEGVRTREVGDVHGEVMPIIFRDFGSRFAENEALLGTNLHLHGGGVHVLRQRVRSPKNFFVELSNAGSSAGLYREFDIGDTQRHVPKLWAWSMAAEFIAPWAGRRDITVLVLRAGKFRPGKTLLEGNQACLQGFEVRHDHPNVPWEDLRVARRQMELLLPDVDPHVFRADHHVGITGKSQASRIEGLGHFLVWHLHIEMLHTEDVPNVLD